MRQNNKTNHFSKQLNHCSGLKLHQRFELFRMRLQKFYLRRDFCFSLAKMKACKFTQLRSSLYMPSLFDVPLIILHPAIT
jgi:hypothetical protein